MIGFFESINALTVIERRGGFEMKQNDNKYMSSLSEMLMISFFGFDYEEFDNIERIEKVCCKKAYLDMCRTLKEYNNIHKGQELELLEWENLAWMEQARIENSKRIN